MAHLALGMGSSHSLIKDPVQWLRRGEADVPNSRFGRALQGLKPELASELTLERCTEQFEQCNAAANALGDVLEESEVDAILVVSNLHGVPHDDFKAVFGIYVGDELPVAPLSSGGDGEASDPDSPIPDWATRAHPAEPDLAMHVLDSLIQDGFDLAHMDRFRPGTGIGHEFTVMYEEYLRKETPLVPFQLSRYLPNQATPERCYALGQALRRAIESWDSDKRVAIAASGGLSHQLVDEPLDQQVVAALMEKDRERLCSLPRERLNVLPGTAEILNWVTVSAAMEDAEMTLLDYVPSYWSLYGTGHGFCFSYWR